MGAEPGSLGLLSSGVHSLGSVSADLCDIAVLIGDETGVLAQQVGREVHQVAASRHLLDRRQVRRLPRRALQPHLRQPRPAGHITESAVAILLAPVLFARLCVLAQLHVAVGRRRRAAVRRAAVRLVAGGADRRRRRRRRATRRLGRLPPLAEGVVLRDRRRVWLARGCALRLLLVELP